MAVLAKSSPFDLEKSWKKLASPPVYSRLRNPEVGLVMVRARAGGNGMPFNLGEMTVTRCTVQVEGGYVGCAYVGGRSPAHAEAAAVFDALLQDPSRRGALMKEVILPLETALKKKKERETERVAATRVEFFTLVRGD